MNKDIERKRILVIEEAALAIKNLLSQAALTMDTKSSIKSKCISIINDTEKKLKDLKTDKEFIEDTIRGLKSSFLRWYNQMVASLERVSKADKSGIVSQTLKSLKGIEVKHKTNAFVIGGSNGQIGKERIEISNIRELMTIYDEGSAGRYVDYVKEVKSAMVEIQDQLASNSLSLYDSKGRQKSIRNMAEIKTRYDLINEDLKKLKDKGSRFVIATAHANASERCSWWQGKIFEIDIDIATRKMGQYPGSKPEQIVKGYIDGKPYYSLKQACANGFLSFNCQHRVVAYYKGVHVPKFNIIEVKKRRDISQKQRYLENRIRQEKSRQILAISPEERKKAQEKSKQLQDIYAEFCELNEVPRYDWRTRVTETERNFNPRLNGGIISREFMASNCQEKLWNSPPIEHTAEELLTLKKRIVEVGFNKHSNVSEFDGDLKLANDMLESAQKFFTVYPKMKGKVKLDIRPIHGIDENDFGSCFGQYITINSSCLRNPEEYYTEILKNRDFFAKETDIDTPIIHELGHVLANVYGIPSLKIAKKLTGIKDTMELMDYIKANVSVYASVFPKGNEIISECMVKYFKESNNEFVLNFIRECNKIIIGR